MRERNGRTARLQTRVAAAAAVKAEGRSQFRNAKGILSLQIFDLDRGNSEIISRENLVFFVHCRCPFDFH